MKNPNQYLIFKLQLHPNPILHNIDTSGLEKIMQKLNFVLDTKKRLQQLNMLETNLIAGRMNAS